MDFSRPLPQAASILRRYYSVVNNLETYLAEIFQLASTISCIAEHEVICHQDDSSSYRDLLRSSYVCSKDNSPILLRRQPTMVEMREARGSLLLLFNIADIFSDRGRGSVTIVQVKTPSKYHYQWISTGNQSKCVVRYERSQTSTSDILSRRQRQKGYGPNRHNQLLFKHCHYCISSARMGDAVE